MLQRIIWPLLRLVILRCLAVLVLPLVERLVLGALVILVSLGYWAASFWTLRTRRPILRAAVTGAVLVAGGVALAHAPYRTAPSAHVYYVAPGGDDGGPGNTPSTPFQHIGRCATLMVAGDTCQIEAGTYRETVSPANSGTADTPITYMPYASQVVTISGADVITGWVQEGTSHVYSTSVTLPVSGTQDLARPIFANQVLLDGTMLPEARWPNATSYDPLTGLARAQAGAGTTSTTITDTSLPAVNWTGARVHIWGGSAFSSQIGTVITSTPGSTSFGFTDAQVSCPTYCANAGSAYYLEGIRPALDVAGEWSYSGVTHTLELWPPSGDSPLSHTVEAKTRTWAVDLSGKSYITVSHLNLVAASITTTATSSWNTLDAITVTYASHYASIPPINGIRQPNPAHRLDTGIILNGSHNTLENSVLAYSAGNGVFLSGSYQTVTNTLIYGDDYEGSYNGAIRLDQPADHMTIAHNTLYNAARALIVSNWTTGSSFVTSTVQLNDLWGAGYLNQDLGLLETCCVLDGTGTRIDHNWLHDSLNGQGVGVYLDNGSGNFTVDHNVIWNAASGTGILFHGSYGGSALGNNRAINNTVVTETVSGITANGPGGDQLVNNIAPSLDLSQESGTFTVTSNLLGTTSWYDMPHNDYRLAAGAGAIDAGTPVSGVTDGYVGSAPDQGAFEFGAPSPLSGWVPGCSMAACADPYTPTRHP